MDPSDVPHARQLTFNVVFANNPPLKTRRVTFYNFNSIDALLTSVAPNNADARRSSGNDWPPGFLFDIAYGCAALIT